MTLQGNYMIAIIVLTDWFKNLMPVFQPMRSKINCTVPCSALKISCAFSKLQVIARNYDWFIRLFAPVEIGQGATQVLVFRQPFFFSGLLHSMYFQLHQLKGCVE